MKMKMFFKLKKLIVELKQIIVYGIVGDNTINGMNESII
jgi:hypothetical protein